MVYWYALIGYILLFAGGYYYVKKERFQYFHGFLVCSMITTVLYVFCPQNKAIEKLLLLLLVFQTHKLRTVKTLGDQHQCVKERMKQEELRYHYFDYRIQANVEEDKQIISMTDHVFDLFKDQWMEKRKKMDAAVTIQHKKTKNTIIVELRLDRKSQREQEIQNMISCLGKYYDCEYKTKGIRKKYHRLTIKSEVLN